jgi:hypothetical protein
LFCIWILLNCLFLKLAIYRYVNPCIHLFVHPLKHPIKSLSEH